MRGTVAKRIRRQVYGKGHHPGPVQVRWGIPHSATRSQKSRVKEALKARQGICIVSDPGRQTYQNTKREYRKGPYSAMRRKNKTGS